MGSHLPARCIPACKYKARLPASGLQESRQSLSQGSIKARLLKYLQYTVHPEAKPGLPLKGSWVKPTLPEQKYHTLAHQA